MIRLCALSLLAFPLVWFQEQELQASITQPSLVAVSEQNLSSSVLDCVSAVTGDFFISEEQFVVQGAEPIKFSQFYASSQVIDRGHRSPLTPHLYMELEVYSNQVSLVEPTGRLLKFTLPFPPPFKEGSKQKSSGRCLADIDCVSQNQSLAKTAHEHIEPRNNFKNCVLELNDDDSFFLFTQDGTKRHYTIVPGLSKKNNTLHYYLQSEKLANGNKVVYGYDGSNRLESIRTTSSDGSKVYAWARIHYRGQRDFDVETSDEQLLQYRFKQFEGQFKEPVFVLEKILATGGPQYSFSYDFLARERKALLTERTLANGTRMCVEYYKVGENSVGGKSVHLEADDKRRNLVKALYAQVGEGNALVLTHTFMYGPGYTEVFDQLGNKTVYRYDSALQLHQIERYGVQGSDQILQSQENFIWGAKGTSEFGLLICKALLDEQHHPLVATTYAYDAEGNLLKETLYGNLSGTSSPLHLDERGLPLEDGVEKYQKRFGYNAQGLRVKEEEDNGLSFAYTYLPGTNLLASKVTSDKGEVKEKEFKTYNSDGLLIRDEIHSESSSKKDEERKIVVITPRSDYPFFGMPAAILEKGFDGVDEKLIKKTELVYSNHGMAMRQEVYDAEGSHRYTLLNEKENGIGLRTNAIGEVARSIFSNSGHLTRYEEFGGKKTSTMVYDGASRMVQLEVGGSDGNRQTTKYHYDVNGNLISMVDAHSNETRYVYSQGGRSLEIHLPPRAGATRAALYPVMKHLYDAAGNEIAYVDGNGALTLTSYNARRMPIQIVTPDRGVKQFIYNLDGTLRCLIDKEGTATYYTWDYKGRETSKKVFSSARELLSEESALYNPFHIVLKRDALGNETHFNHDVAGRMSSEKMPLGVIEYTYDALGNLCLTKRTSDQQDTELHKVTHDLLGRPIEEHKEDAKGHILDKIRYDYRPLNNEKVVTHVIDSKETQENYVYDSLGRVIRYVDVYGRETTTKYNDRFQNALGQFVLQKTETDSVGIVTIETLDAYSQIASVEKRGKSGELLSLDSFIYDAVGQLSKQESAIVIEGEIKSSLITFWEYDGLGRITSRIDGAGSEQQKVTSYEYTFGGQVAKTIKPSGVVIEREFDGLGRITKLRASDGSVAYAYKYNLLGQLIECDDLLSGAKIERAYDAKGRLIGEKLANGLRVESKYDFLDRRTFLQLPDYSAVEYTYDGLLPDTAFRRSSSGEALYKHRYLSFNGAGHLIEEEMVDGKSRVSYELDAAGRRFAVFSGNLIDRVEELNDAGRPVRSFLKSPFGHAESHLRYDQLGYLSSERGLFSHTFTNDSIGSRLSKNEKVFHLTALRQLSSTDVSEYLYDGQGNPIAKRTLLGDFNYTYNESGRLVEVAKPGKSRITFEYDSATHLVTKTFFIWKDGGWQARAIGGDGEHDLFELHTLNSLLAPECILCSYDQCGNQIAKRTSLGNYYYTYDALDRLVEVTRYGEARVCFTYDGLNRRQSQVTYLFDNERWKEQRRLNFIYDDQNEIGAALKDKILQLRVPGAELLADKNQPIAIELGAQRYQPLFDLNGSTTLLYALGSGELAEGYQYSTLGQHVIFSPSNQPREKSVIGNPWRFTTEAYDDEAGLIYSHGSFYDPLLGIWLTPQARPLGVPLVNPYAALPK